MEVYTYSEARQNLSTLLDNAELSGKVIIKRKDGRSFSIMPESSKKSPLDVPFIEVDISTPELVSLIRKQRSRKYL